MSKRVKAVIASILIGAAATAIAIISREMEDEARKKIVEALKVDESE